MASPCSPLDLFLEGINFMDPIALDGGGGKQNGGNNIKISTAAPNPLQHLFGNYDRMVQK